MFGGKKSLGIQSTAFWKNWKIVNSAICCTEPSFLLLLHQVQAFIGKIHFENK